MTLVRMVQSSALADYSCAVKRSPEDADLCVFETKSEEAARGKSGLWCVVQSKEAAEISVWLSYATSLADFSICWVSSPDLAG